MTKTLTITWIPTHSHPQSKSPLQSFSPNKFPNFFKIPTLHPIWGPQKDTHHYKRVLGFQPKEPIKTQTLRYSNDDQSYFIKNHHTRSHSKRAASKNRLLPENRKKEREKDLKEHRERPYDFGVGKCREKHAIWWGVNQSKKGNNLRRKRKRKKKGSWCKLEL